MDQIIKFLDSVCQLFRQRSIYCVHKATPIDQKKIHLLLQRVKLFHPWSTISKVEYGVVREGNEVIGCVGVVLSPPDGLIISLVVDPDFRNRNLGKLLVNWAIKEAYDNGVRRLFLATEEAKRYFEKTGFALIAQQKLPVRLQERCHKNEPSFQDTTYMCLSLDALKDEVKESIFLTRIGLLINTGLVAAKLGVGWTIGSLALLADGIHSVSDVITDCLVLISLKSAARPADANHAYGHGKYETITSGAVALLLIGGGIFLTYRAGLDLHRQAMRFPGPLVLIVAAISILLKEGLFRVMRAAAKRMGSPLLSANAWHQRTDALSSVAVLVGGAAGLLNFGLGDGIAGLVVGIMVFIAGGKILLESVHELTEGTLSVEEQRAIEQAIAQHPQVYGWHKLRTRRMGRGICVDLHIQVNSDHSVQEAHMIATAVEAEIQKACRRPVNITIHIEPWDEENR
jgi:cation diffusion facilitator family transporter